MKEQTKQAIKWIDELLITKEKQGRMKLGNSEEGFCCLGLGCVITETLYDPNQGVSIPFAAKVGLATTEGYTMNGNYIISPNSDVGYFSIANANDNGMSFEEIGHFIKNNPETVFVSGVAQELKQHYGN